jgi:hypothetical protein
VRKPETLDMPLFILLLALIQFTSVACAAGQVQATNPDEQPMRFQLYRPCLREAAECIPRIFAQGSIDPDSAAALRAFITQARAANPNLPSEMMVCLDSGRGDARAAIRLGATIRALNLSTCVQARYQEETAERAAEGRPSSRILAEEPLCTSACVLSLAGGISRYVAPDAKVAVRRFVEIDQQPPDGIARLSSEVLALYLQYHGVNPRLLDLAQATPPDSARFLSEDEMRFYRIVTPSTHFTSLQR